MRGCFVHKLFIWDLGSWSLYRGGLYSGVAIRGFHCTHLETCTFLINRQEFKIKLVIHVLQVELAALLYTATAGKGSYLTMCALETRQAWPHVNSLQPTQHFHACSETMSFSFKLAGTLRELSLFLCCLLALLTQGDQSL